MGYCTIPCQIQLVSHPLVLPVWSHAYLVVLALLARFSSAATISAACEHEHV